MVKNDRNPWADRSRYLNPYTDYGFRKIFGEEECKELLISFLNSVIFQGGDPVVELTYQSKAPFPERPRGSEALFEAQCQRRSGNGFFLLMQNARHPFVKDRSVRYLSDGIRRLPEPRAPWDVRLQEVCLVAFMNYAFPDEGGPSDCLHEIKLMEGSRGRVFYEKLKLVYLEMPRFEKRLSELWTMRDKWLYVLKNLPYLAEPPKTLRGPIFERLFERADLTRLNPEELRAYHQSLMAFLYFHP